MFIFTVEDCVTLRLDYYKVLILRIFILTMTNPIHKVTVIFVHV